jgi:hypothetical protein
MGGEIGPIERGHAREDLLRGKTPAANDDVVLVQRVWQRVPEA